MTPLFEFDESIPELSLKHVLSDEYVDVHGACEIVGIAKQTFQNLRSLGQVDVKPVGQLRYIGRAPMVYRRSDIEAWAQRRKK